MTIITSDNEYGVDNRNACCNVCGGGVKAPHLWWRCETDLFICAPCCLQMRKGFLADVIQLSAIALINNLGPEYKDQVLIRQPIGQAEADQRRLRMMKHGPTRLIHGGLHAVQLLPRLGDAGDLK